MYNKYFFFFILLTLNVFFISKNYITDTIFKIFEFSGPRCWNPLKALDEEVAMSRVDSTHRSPQFQITIQSKLNK